MKDSQLKKAELENEKLLAEIEKTKLENEKAKIELQILQIKVT